MYKDWDRDPARFKRSRPAAPSLPIPVRITPTARLPKTLATEWGPRGINVNAIAPTVFRSALTEWIFADTEAGRASRERNYARISMKRLGEPEDFIGIVLYLLSAASDFVTGQVIYVDGGYTAA